MKPETRKLTQLRPNPLNPRDQVERNEKFEELKQSIAAKGIIQPIVITPDNVIIAGERRFEAAKEVKLAVVPVVIRDDVDEATQIETMLAENLQREALNPIQTASACKGLLNRGRKYEEVANTIGMSVAALGDYLGLLDLPKQLQAAVATYDLTLGAAKALRKLDSKADQVDIGLQAARLGWSVRQVASSIAMRQATHRGTIKGGGNAESSTSKLATHAPRPAPTHVNPTTIHGPRPSQGDMPLATFLELMTNITVAIRRNPDLATDFRVKGAVESFAAAWKDAHGRKVA